MIELTCQSCGEKASVHSLLTAAQQPCRRCSQLLMGPLARGTRTYHPSAAEEPASVTEYTSGGSKVGVWLGILAGTAAGIAGVYAIAQMGSGLPFSTRNAILGALAGVLLAPILAVSGFLSMLILPFSIEGLIGDSAWGGLAKALHQRTIRPLIFPLLLYVALPMAACAFGASKLKPSSPSMTPPAYLGAALLGAILGGIGGSLMSRPRHPV